MRSGVLCTASDSEADAIWPALDATHVFDSYDDLQRFRADGAWRVQVTERGEAVVLERWRSHLDVLAMLGVWCSRRRVPELVQQVRRIASARGYGRLLSPMVDTALAASYERAGLAVHTRIVTLRRDRRGWNSGEPTMAEGMHLRRARKDDLPGLVQLDSECFDDFWRYDGERLARYLAKDRMVVAESSHEVIGYTLATTVRGTGTIGRLAVSPSARLRGVGETLLIDALGYLFRTGAEAVSLCTQEGNLASRALYRKVGLMELDSRLVLLSGPTG